MSIDAIALERGRNQELALYLDGDTREQELYDLLECRLAETVEELREIKKEISYEYKDLDYIDFKDVILEELEAHL
jgi:hypothetical protein